MDQQTAPNINILSFQSPQQTGVNKFLTWCLQYGRMIIIITELLVIAAFLSRFYFDTRLSDLNDHIQAESNLVQQSQISEQQFLALQTSLNQAGQIIDSRKDYAAFFANLNTIKPPDITLTQASILGNNFTFTAQVASVASLNTFLQNLNTTTYFTNVSINDITIKDGLYSFGGTATIQNAAFK